VTRGSTYLSEMTDRDGPGVTKPTSHPAPGLESGPAADEAAPEERPRPGFLAVAEKVAAQGFHVRPAPRPIDRRHQRRWVPVVAALLSLLIGVAYVIEGARPALFIQYRLHKITELAPGLLTQLSRTADVIVGLLLLMLSHALRRRKHRAWQGVMLLLAAGIVIHAVAQGRHHSLVPETAAVVLLALLWIYRREFYAQGDPRTRWRALGALAGLAVADVIIGMAYLSLTHGLAADYTMRQRLESVIYGLLGFNGPVDFVTVTRGDFFGVLTGGLGLFTLIVVGYLFLRPASREGRLSQRDASQIRALLVRQGERDSLGYFSLRADKSIIWSPTGKACIGYRALSGVMLASGDPIGDPEAWPGAIHAFLEEAARHAWVPAVLGCSELGAEVWCREGGLNALEFGDEAVVDVADFTLQGRCMRNVRQMVTRVAKSGYIAEVRRVGDIPRSEIAQLVGKAGSWRGSPTERGFSMSLGRIGAVGDDDCVIATATRDGVLHAILHFAPWGSDGLSLDLMRRDRSAQPGLNDFLIVEAIKSAPDLGVKRVSLNFAFFRSALARGERIGAGPVLRAWRSILLFLSRWFQIESLWKFNEKFCPQWVPRFFLYSGTRDILRISLAALEAEAFLVWPTVPLRRQARRLARRFRAGQIVAWPHRQRPGAAS
jgi:lysyl-tRNA synthetase, class II